MKIISGFREKQLKKMKDEWDMDKALMTAEGIDKDKLINSMKEDLDKMFILLGIS